MGSCHEILRSWLPRNTGYLSLASLAEVADEARAGAERALALDPELGEGEISLGFLADAEWKREEAERHYRRGLELRPGYAVAHHWFGTHLEMTGRHAEAITSLQQALRLDPLSLPIQMALGTVFLFSGRLEDAEKLYRKAIELDPAFAMTYNNLALCLVAMGRFEEALEADGESSRLNPDWTAPEYVEALRASYADGGPQGYWGAVHRWHSDHIQDDPEDSYHGMAIACAHLERVDEAFAHLDRCVASRAPHAPLVLSDPFLASLRSDPRFAEIKRKLGLA